MTFVHPWAMGVGLGVALLPPAIHWLTRPRPVRVPLSTIRFVREALQQRRSRHRLRDALVLFLRTLAVMLLAGAIARPQAGGQPLVTPSEAGNASRVVILDVSQSMAAQGHGIELFERARPLAALYLNEQAGLQANLIVAGASARPVFDRLSTNFAALREELAQARVRPERLKVQAAINQASELLARTGNEPGRRRELVVISDYQRSNWVAADFTPLPEATQIQLDSIAPAEALANLAVLRVGCQGRPEQGREVRLEVEVGNFSPTPRQVQVEVTLGEASYRLEGLCPPGAKATLSADVTLHALGWQTGEARLVGVQDALAADDARSFVLEVRPPPTYSLITRQPAELRPSSNYYLERGLVPLLPRPGRSEARVLRVEPSQLNRESLAAADVLVLDHPGRLSAEAIQLLASLVRRGRGLLYVAAETTDAANLKLLVDAAGPELQMPVEFMPPPASQRRRDLFLTEVRREQAPFAVFGESLAGILAPLRFSGGLTSRRLEGSLPDEILATYSDRSACLVVSPWGAGTLAVLNADLATSNLATSPAFVPLIGELLGRLVGRQPAGEQLACGEPMAVYLPAAAGPAAGLQILGPATDDAGQLHEESSGVLWRCAALGTPGLYRVKRESTTVFAVASAIAAEESDLRSLEASVLRERLAGGRSVHYRAAAGPGEDREDWWMWLLGACVACLLGELLALKLFRT